MGECSKGDIEDVLRSVIQSSKGGVPLRKLQGEFKTMVGHTINFNKFGYSTLEAMLKDMPNIIRLSRGLDGDFIVNAVADQKTKHLAELISKQKTTKTRPIIKPRRMMGHNKNWYPPYTPFHQRNPYPHPRSPQMPLWRLPHINTFNTYNRAHNSFNPNFHQQMRPSPRHFQPRLPPNFQNFPNFQKRSLPPPKTNFELPPRFQKQQAPSNAESTFNTSSFKPQLDNQPIQPQTDNQTKRDSVVRTNPVISNSTNLPVAKLKPSQNFTEPGLPCPNPKSNKEVVENYAFSNGLQSTYHPSPQNTKGRIKWLSKLVLGSQKFNSYPNEMDSAEEANEEAAKRAVEKLKIDPNLVILPVVSTQDSFEVDRLVEQIRLIVSENPKGAVHFHIQEQFKRRHKMRLPTNWLEFLANVDDIRIDRADETHYILFQEKSARSTPESVQEERNGGTGSLGSPAGDSPAGDSPVSESSSQYSLPDTVTLPDTEPWDVYISYATDISNIWFRLCDYMEEFEKMAVAMETFYNQQRSQQLLQPVLDPVCGQPYCAFSDETWHRISVQDVSDDNMVECLFLDNGDLEYLRSDIIFELDKKFLELPFQAVGAELACLPPGFAKDTVINERFIEMVLGKSLIAKPDQREGEVLALFLTDTSTDDDINVNDLLLQSIFAELAPPDLNQPGRVVECILSTVLPSGDVMLQDERSLSLLELLLDDVVDIFEAQKSLASLTEVFFTKKYCVLHNEKWCRATPISQEISVDNKVPMLLIDFGFQENIPLSNICTLNGETSSLATIPFLASRCRLNGIEASVWNANAVDKLFQLIPHNTKLLIKVVSQTSPSLPVPVVDLFKRLSPNNELISINQTLAISLMSSLAGRDKPMHVERKLSRPNPLQAPSPPAVPSPTSSYQFTDVNEKLSGPNVQSPTTPVIPSPTASYQFLNTNDISAKDTPFTLSQEFTLGKPQNGLPNSAGANSNSSNISHFSFVTPASEPKNLSHVPVTKQSSLPSPAGLTSSPFVYNAVSEPAKSTTPPVIKLISQQQSTPSKGEYFDVHITSAASPCNFTCQHLQMLPKIEELCLDMVQFYNSEENVFELHPSIFIVGEFYAYKHKSGDWYRVCVQNIIAPDLMVVYLIDFGGFEMAKLCDLQMLYERFRCLPYQAITASLSPGEKSGNSDSKLIQTPELCVRFKEMVEEKNFVSTICEKKLENVTSSMGLSGSEINIILTDTSSEIDLDIYGELLKFSNEKSSL